MLWLSRWRLSEFSGGVDVEAENAVGCDVDPFGAGVPRRAAKLLCRPLVEAQVVHQAVGAPSLRDFPDTETLGPTAAQHLPEL